MDITKESILNALKEKEGLLKPNQKAVSLPIIKRMYKKMNYGILFQDILVSKNYIINGHHRYISSILTDYKLGIVGNWANPSNLNDYSWENVEYTDTDFDSPEDIDNLNKQDADYNNMKIEEIESIID